MARICTIEEEEGGISAGDGQREGEGKHVITT